MLCYDTCHNISCNHMLTLLVLSVCVSLYSSSLPYFWSYVPLCAAHLLLSTFTNYYFFFFFSLSLFVYSQTPLFIFFTSTDLQPDEVWQLFAIPQVLPLPRVYACWGGRPTLTGPLPDSLQSCAVEAQCQLRPLHPFHSEKGTAVAFFTLHQRGYMTLLTLLIRLARQVKYMFRFSDQQESRKQRSGRSLTEDGRDESADKKRGIFFSWSRNRSFGKGPKKKDIGDINLGKKWTKKPVAVVTKIPAVWSFCNTETFKVLMCPWRRHQITASSRVAMS